MGETGEDTGIISPLSLSLSLSPICPVSLSLSLLFGFVPHKDAGTITPREGQLLSNARLSALPSLPRISHSPSYRSLAGSFVALRPTIYMQNALLATRRLQKEYYEQLREPPSRSRVYSVSADYQTWTYLLLGREARRIPSRTFSGIWEATLVCSCVMGLLFFFPLQLLALLSVYSCACLSSHVDEKQRLKSEGERTRERAESARDEEIAREPERRRETARRGMDTRGAEEAVARKRK